MNWWITIQNATKNMLIDCNKHLFVVYGLQRAIAQVVSKWTELNPNPKSCGARAACATAFWIVRFLLPTYFNENDAEKC